MRAISLLAVLGAVAAVAWIVTSVRQPRLAARGSSQVKLLTYDRPFPPEGRFTSDPYIGSQACAECHPGEYALHTRSGHALTLRPAGWLTLSRKLDGMNVADPELPGVSWSYRYSDGDLHIIRKEDGKIEDSIADYAFGSGHHATTFVSVIKPEIPAILEHRLTFYEQSACWTSLPATRSSRRRRA